ncbi:pyridoxal phosphate-dependent decarboxylase family protein [Actibacterium pelagium]|uniref:Cytochrome d ubiquinol oxidase subunit I n=1 Tax=Actibacterium pelagium TaxID=2029103 RepID=A0A917EKI0_9RHOB|nr:pyridoxal-dependent decarboxylase [Actibacterium pelagium]GGE47819.1 cytochrome d ubiquinol oxidase subunit I [Actibacterium pelagium]
MANGKLDPKDWPSFRDAAHKMLDDALDKMETAETARVWTAPTPELIDAMSQPLPEAGQEIAAIGEQLTDLLPFGPGNTHPRFWGWVHGSGTPAGLLPAIAMAAMNANLGGRDTGAIHVEKQVLDWSKAMMGFPQDASGLLVSGTSMATVIAMKTARDAMLGVKTRKTGLGSHSLVAYTSAQTHSCVARAFDIIGLGADTLRLVPCTDDYTIDLGALRKMIADDLAAGRSPFALIGTAGAVNVGAIDDLDALADIARAHDMWYHVDAAIGGAAMLSDGLRPRFKGLERADSVAFDFHKWLQVNYDAGCVLIRDADAHYASFNERPAYLAQSARGLSGGDFWPVDYGPELSRDFRALKVWAHLSHFGTKALGAAVDDNHRQAKLLGQLVDEAPGLQLMAPVALNIVCFRATGQGDLDKLNNEIVWEMQESGFAVPSTTVLNGQTAIRINLTNHRTRDRDLRALVVMVQELAEKLTAA